MVHKKRRVEEEQLAFGTYASKAGADGVEITYRKKKQQGGSYYVVTETVGKEMDREDLLDLRMKQKADRHCR